MTKVRKKEFEKILREHPQARERDEALIYVWLKQYGDMDPQKTPISKMLMAMSKGSMPTLETFSRLRRAIQTDHPELQGKRNRLARTKDVKSQLGYGNMG